MNFRCPACGAVNQFPPQTYHVRNGEMPCAVNIVFGDLTKCRVCDSDIARDDRDRPVVLFTSEASKRWIEEAELRDRSYTREEYERGDMRRDQERLVELRRMRGANNDGV
jgi:hypothetical protein